MSSNPKRSDSDAPPAVDINSVRALSDEVSPSSDVERRQSERVSVTWSVDCETEDTFLYASISNISEMGIFVRTEAPLPIGTTIVLRFASPEQSETFCLKGTVQWANRTSAFRETINPGMGIRFINLQPDERERIVEMVRTIAYLREDPSRVN